MEMNGTAREDYHLGYRTGPKRRLAYTLRMFVERLHIKRATGVISVSKNLSKTLARRYSNIQDESRFHTVYNGCGTHFVRQAARTVRTEVIHVVFVGTFTPWDGHEKIIDLYTAVLEKGVPVHFEIAGPNVYSSILYQKLKENEHFTFYPGIDYLDLPSFYERMDAAISLAGIKRSKKVEKSTLKLLEYRAAKLPIFTTRSFGNEYVENLNIGVLVNQEEMDDPNLLGRKFVDFLENLDLYKKSYDTAPSPRTWKDAARETRDILSL
ncbi:MAG: glycosyltransferase [Spirochaetales bacterium]|nr:glycosyltransferase [Spirochaetales bacterium]MCF7937747.1 glycosyltransferase [Spirochaetales bacterium]